MMLASLLLGMVGGSIGIAGAAQGMTWFDVVTLQNNPTMQSVDLEFPSRLKFGNIELPAQMSGLVDPNPGPHVQQGHPEWGGSGAYVTIRLSKSVCHGSPAEIRSHEAPGRLPIQEGCVSTGRKIGSMTLQFWSDGSCHLKFEVGPWSAISESKAPSCVSPRAGGGQVSGGAASGGRDGR